MSAIKGKYWHAVRMLSERHWSKIQPQPVVRRVEAKRGKLANRIERNKYSRSMMVAQHPKGMLPVPRFNDERTKSLFASYQRRITVRQDRNNK